MWCLNGLLMQPVDMALETWAALPASAQTQHPQAGQFTASPRHHAQAALLWAFRCHPCREFLVIIVMTLLTNG